MQLLAHIKRVRRKLLVRRQQAGQALVEFTLVIVPLLMLVLGILAYWPIFTARDAIAFAAAAGAHEGAISGGDQARVRESVDALLSTAAIDLSTRTVTVGCAGGCARYQPVTVRVAVEVKPWITLPFMAKSYLVSAEYTRASEVDGGPGATTGRTPLAPAWQAPGAGTQLPGGDQ